MQEENKAEKETTEGAPTEQSQATDKPRGGDSKKTLISIIVVIVLIIGALEFSGTTSLFGGRAIATVNGEKITQTEYDLRISQIFNSEQAQLFDLEDPALRKSIEDQILTEIVNTKLLIQKATEAGFVSTEAEVETEYQLILNRMGSELNTPEEKQELLEVELAKNGLEGGSFRKNIGDQLIIEQYFSSLIDESTLTPTEEEVAQYYTQLNASQEGVPALEEIRVEIETQIISQKRQQAVGGIIENLRTEADIVIAE